MEYHIIVADSISDLVRRVNGAIGEGWKPQGGVCVYETSGGQTLYVQAIVR